MEKRRNAYSALVMNLEKRCQLKNEEWVVD
jgi:hypothetical protein